MALVTQGRVVDPLKFAKLMWPKVTFYKQQREIIYSVIENAETFVPAGNMLGKDFVAAFITLWFFLSRHPCRIVTTSVDGTQLEGVLWGEIRRFIQTSKYPLEESKGGPLVVNHLHIRKKLGPNICGLSYIVGRVAAKGEGMLGHHIAQTGDGIPRTLFLADEACHSSDTEVMTDRGFIPWADVNPEDRFYTLDPKTKQTHFKKATRFYRSYLRNVMFEYEDGEVSYCVTPNHRMLWSIKFKNKKRLPQMKSESRLSQPFLQCHKRARLDLFDYFLFKSNQEPHLLNTSNFKVIDYHGWVYCATVPPYHTLFTRRDGKCVWSGNSGVEDISYERADTWAERKLVIGNPYPTRNFFYMGVKGGDLAPGSGNTLVQVADLSAAEAATNGNEQSVNPDHTVTDQPHDHTPRSSHQEQPSGIKPKRPKGKSTQVSTLYRNAPDASEETDHTSTQSPSPYPEMSKVSSDKSAKSQDHHNSSPHTKLQSSAEHKTADTTKKRGRKKTDSRSNDDSKGQETLENKAKTDSASQTASTDTHHTPETDPHNENTPNPDTYFSGKRLGAATNAVLYRKVIKIKGEDSPNVRLGLLQEQAKREPSNEMVVPGVLPYSEYKKRRETWDEVRQCIGLDAEFYEGAENLLYPPEWLNNAEQKAVFVGRRFRKALAMGIDTAEGGDKSAWAVVDEHGLIELVVKKTPDTSVIPNETLALMYRYKLEPSQVVFDMGGGGREHADLLRSYGKKVRTVAFGTPVSLEPKSGRRSTQDKREFAEQRYVYKDRRAEMYGELRSLLDPKRDPVFTLPAQYTELRRQLSLIPLIYDREGRLEIPPKKRPEGQAQSIFRPTLIEIIGHSPDEADALVVAVWAMLNPEEKKIVGAL